MNTAETCDASSALSRARGRVLLVNPPVVDSRYPWIRWNQPLDLLKLGTFLKEERGCEVKLFDFMVPSSSGAVPKRKSDFDQEPGEATRWMFGRSWETFGGFLEKLGASKWIPDAVWITSLTSFWWQTIPGVVNCVRSQFKSPWIVLCGSYPILETQHAARFADVDAVVSTQLDVASRQADFSLYGERKLPFCALDLTSSSLVDEIAACVERGTGHFVFFNEDIFGAFDRQLRPVLHEVIDKRWAVRFHGICGVNIDDFPVEHAELLAKGHFAELHFEPRLTDAGLVDEASYRKVLTACQQAGLARASGDGWRSGSSQLSGFLWIGRPHDDLERLVWNALKLVQLTGMAIPKPYSPDPRSADYQDLVALYGGLEPEDMSPHRLPFSEFNGIGKSDYEDLYRLSAFLNLRVRGRGFDFLGTSYLNRVVRESLRSRRWDT